MSAFLKKDDILNKQDLQFEDVDVPEWGGKVRICEFSSDKAVEYSAHSTETGANYLAELLALSIVDESFKPVFSPEDIKALGRKSGKVIGRLVKVATRLNGMGQTGEEKARKN